MTLTDKEKIEKALSRITKIMDKYEKDPNVDYDTNKEWIDGKFDQIKNKLSDTTTSDEVKINEALTEIYRQIFEYAVIQDSSYFHLRAIKKVKSILGQIPAKEEELRDFYIGMRNER